MPTYTSLLRFVEPATGEINWGTTVNTGFTQLADSAIAGTANITMGAADYTLSNVNGGADEARAMFLVLGGAPGAERNVICPAVSKLYFVTNNTGFAQTVKTALGSGVSVPNGTSMVLRCDGTNVVVALSYIGSLKLKLTNALEIVTVNATAASGVINYDVATQSVLYYTNSASANWTVNLRASAVASLNTAMATGESVTVAFLVTQGATAYYNSTVQVDGTTSGVTTFWQGGGAPLSGNPSGVDIYTYTVIKTASAAFSVFASQTRFAQ